MNIKKRLKELDKLYKALADETSSFGMELVEEIVQLEIDLESYCNK